MTSKSTVVLELDDIQAGALEPRPVPYAGLYQILRLDDRHGGRELPAAANPVSQLSCLLRSQDAGVARRGTQLPGTQSPRGAGGVTRYLSPRVSAGNGRTQRRSLGTWEKTLPSTGRNRWVRRTSISWWSGSLPTLPAWRPLSATPATPHTTCPASCPSGNSTYTPQLTCATCSVSRMASAIRPSRVSAFPALIRTKCRLRPASSSWGTRTRPTTSPQYRARCAGA